MLTLALVKPNTAKDHNVNRFHWEGGSTNNGTIVCDICDGMCVGVTPAAQVKCDDEGARRELLSDTDYKR